MSRAEIEIEVRVNGEPVRARVAARTSLADFLREALALTGTHVGCEQGICGACTVLVEGRSARACLMLAVQADGASVTTVEGLERGGELAPVQQAFLRHHALQCGFCTAGFVVLATEMVIEREQGRGPSSRAEVRARVAGNLCRCTGYAPIVDAMADVLGLGGKPRGHP